MNCLERPLPGILGGEADLDRLKRRDSSRLLVISDSHGHYQAVEQIIKKQGPLCDALLFAGDGIWDIVQYVENTFTSSRLRDALPPVVALVAGNGDGDEYRITLPSDAAPEEAPGLSLTVPDRLIVQASGYQVFLTHGHRYSVDVSLDILLASAHATACDIAIYGHTHIPFTEEVSHLTALNPGSVSRPRGNSQACCALLELDSTRTQPIVRFIQVKA